MEPLSPKFSAASTITTLFGSSTNFLAKWRQQNPLHQGEILSGCSRISSCTSRPLPRDVSAEIFVVCRDFLAPRHIDPKFLDPRHVFKDLASIPSVKGTSANDVQAVFHPEKTRRRREGYADGDYTLYNTISAADFIKDTDPLTNFVSFNKITFTTDEEKRHVMALE